MIYKTRCLKQHLKKVFIFLKIDITKNIKYDRLTDIILKSNLRKDSNCIDVGCHKGEILEIFLKYSPNGIHYGFEPIPYLFESLLSKFETSAHVLPFALAEKGGSSKFQLVKNAPAYSGIIKRRYDIPNPEIEEIDVELRPLDEIIPDDLKIDLIKIDVEGGEFGVLKGAFNLIKKNKPLIIFECGLGASDFYGTTPDDIYSFITQNIGMKISTLGDFIKKKKSLSPIDFKYYFNTNKEYYFVAHNE